MFGSLHATRATKESYMHEVLDEIYLQNFLWMDIIFRDESSNGN